MRFSVRSGYRWMCAALMLFLLTFNAGAVVSVDMIPNVHLRDSTQFVSNPSGILSSEAVKRLNGTIGKIWHASSAEIVVVAIDEADTDDLDKFATALFEKWGIGKKDKDNGLLILISRDQRQAVIRTGRGMDGVMTDAYASRIIRNVMAPKFRLGDYDGGVEEAIEVISAIVTSPEAANELMSKYSNNSAVTGIDDDLSLGEFFTYYFYFALFLTGVLIIVWIALTRKSRGQSAHKQYDELHRLLMPSLMMSVFGLGLPVIVYWLVKRKMKRLRDKPRICPHCRKRMNRLDEVTDNLYLTAPQNTEEELKSVDYDVWLCPDCSDTIIEPYVNHSSVYEQCELCHTKAARQVANRVLRQPTTTREGQGAKIYHCSHCGNDFNRYYPIAKIPPVVVAPTGGRGSGGGGFGGGSFGGGATMGGGARGGW